MAVRVLWSSELEDSQTRLNKNGAAASLRYLLARRVVLISSLRSHWRIEPRGPKGRWEIFVTFYTEFIMNI